MDGNNRWAKKNNKSIYDTYKIGAKNLLKLTDHTFSNYNITTISAFALSSHNLNRSKKILSQIIRVLDDFSDLMINDFDYNFKIKFIGNYNFLSKKIVLKLQTIENKNINKKKKLAIFINYSGKNDILNSISNLISEKSSINKKNFEKNLLTYGMPDPEFILRTGGYQRLSDFMLYQSSFTELFFTKKLWPDFKAFDLDKIISTYYSIERKFGK